MACSVRSPSSPAQPTAPSQETGEAASSSPTASTPVGKKTSNSWNLKAERKAWSCSYWPFSSSEGDTVGDPGRNLWAMHGCLDKFDKVLTARGKKAGARNHELVPALNFLKGDGSACGYYIPSYVIRESDAERTTGVDFSGSGKLDPKAEVDFLDSNNGFGKNGETNGNLSVGWWGSCDQVALAGLLFDKPTKNASIDGIEFTPLDIMGLLTVIANSQTTSSEYCGWRFQKRPDLLELNDGRILEGRATKLTTKDCLKHTFKRVHGNQIIASDFKDDVFFMETSGEKKVYTPEQIKSLTREDRNEPAAHHFHATVKKWLREGRAFAMDKDSGEHVWNINVDEAEIKKDRTPPRNLEIEKLVGFNGPVSGKDLCFYSINLKKDGYSTNRYRYWIEKDGDKDINSGWLTNNPAFLWRPKEDQPKFDGPNPRNPFVNPDIVREILEKSNAPEIEPASPQEPSETLSVSV